MLYRSLSICFIGLYPCAFIGLYSIHMFYRSLSICFYTVDLYPDVVLIIFIHDAGTLQGNIRPHLIASRTVLTRRNKTKGSHLREP